MFDKFIEKKIVPGSDIDNRFKILINPPRDASVSFINALQDYVKNLNLSLKFNPNSYDFKNAFSEKELEIITKDALVKIKKALLNKENYSKELKEDLNYYEELLNNPDAKYFQYESALLQLKAIDEKLNLNKNEMILTRPVCNTDNCKKSYREFFKKQDWADKFAKYEKALNSPVTKSNAINRCKASLIIAENSKSSFSKGKKIFSDSKDLIINNMLPNFSEHSQLTMLDYVNNRLISDNVNILKPDIDYIKKFKEESINYVSKNTITIELDKFSIIEKLFVLDKSFDEIIPFDNVDPCGTGDTPTNAWDFFLPMKLAQQITEGPEKEMLQKMGTSDHIFISDYSCQHADHGKHNTLHEIAHGLNFLFATTPLSKESTDYYNKIRSCIVSVYPDARPSVGLRDHKGDNLLTEEDTADVFAFMANVNDKKIYSCQFLKPSQVNNSYVDLNFISSSEDSHSTGFSRVLLEVVNKDITLPESCQNLIKEQQPKMRLNKCI